MSFLDKLELMLYESKDIYCTAYYTGVNTHSLVLEVNAHEVNCSKTRQSYIKQGISEMISYLKDPINNEPQKYKNFFFNTKPNSILNRVKELNPTDEDLINLYKYVANGFSFSLFDFIPLLSSRESILNIIKLGHDYSYNWENRRAEYLKECMLLLIQYNLSEDEFIDVISHYIKNSKKIIECEGERNLIALCNFFVKNEQKCKELIKATIGLDVQIQSDKVEKKVIKLEMDDSFFIRRYGLINPYSIEECLMNFTKNVKNNLPILNHTLSVDYYKTDKHNLILESNNGNSSELIEILDMYFNYYLSNIKDFIITGDYFKHLHYNPEIFTKMIWNATLKQELIKKITITDKIIKI